MDWWGKSLLGRVISGMISLTLAFGVPLAQVGVAYAETPQDAEQSASPSSNETSPTVVREDKSRRTENSKHFLLSDGTYRADISAGAVHYEDAVGEWQDIDTTLMPGYEPGEYRTRGAASELVVAGQAANKRPVRLTRNGWSLELDMLGVSENAKLVVGNQARYLSVANDTDLLYEATGDGLKETLILKSPDAPRRFEFFMALDGLELRAVPGAGWALYEPDAAEPEYYLGGLEVFDSSVDPETGVAARCESATMTVESCDGGVRIVYEVSDDWLQDPSRAYPVYVDPTVTSTIATYVYQYTPGVSYGSNTRLHVGKQTNGLEVAYTKWSLNSLPDGCNILNATASWWLVYAYTGATERLARCTSSWGESTTWTGRPSLSQITTKYVSGSDKWIAWDVDDVVRDWHTGRATNYGLALWQDSTVSRHKYASDDESYSSHRPTLSITYEVPTASVGGYSSSYRVGDTITATMRVSTADTSRIRNARILVNGVDVAAGIGDAEYAGLVGWFSYSDVPYWEISPAPGGGYFGFRYNGQYGNYRIVPLVDQWSVVNGSGYKDITFKWIVDDDYGDVQNNDLDTRVTWGTTTEQDGDSGWKSQNTNIDIYPKLITDPVASTQAGDWFREVDRNSDGEPDTPNDFADVGRGSVSLSWDPSPLADGYRIYMFDGNTYHEVGDTVGNANTSWSTDEAGIFPGDSEIGQLSGTFDGDPFYRTRPFSIATRQTSVSIGGIDGSGVVVSDGSYLYVRAHGTDGGPDQWTKVGSGYANTTAGAVLGTVGPEFAGKEIGSAFYLDGFIYNGYATSPTTIEGVWRGASATADTRVLTFSSPLLDKSDGTELTAQTSGILLTADDQHIYNVAKSGSQYKVREYTADGAFVGDHLVGPVPEASLPIPVSAASDGERLYIIEGTSPRRVLTVRLSDWQPIRTTAADDWASGVQAASYDPANDVFWAGVSTSQSPAEVRSYAGAGLDLRDDPEALYEGTAGSAYDDRHDYFFRVAPYSELSAASWSANAYESVTLDVRTAFVDDDPRHTAYDLGELAKHTGTVELDSAALRLETTDLSIASWGPNAGVSRSYSSVSTETAGFAPGWLFNYEQRLEFIGEDVVYVDATGEEHRFDYEAGFARADTDFDMKVRVDSLDNTHDWAKAGLMLRTGPTQTDSLDGDAAMAMATVTPANGVRLQWREHEGGTCQSAGPTGITAPVWLRMKRTGDTITALYSTDGSTWSEVHSTSGIELDADMRLGVAHTTHVDGVAGTAVFSDMSIDGDFDARMMDVAWIDSTSFAGYPAVSDDTITLRSEGADFWGTSDQGSLYHTEEGGWSAPNGYYAKLTSPDAGTYMLSFKDRSTLTFDGSGRLLSETDRNGNQVTYDWSGGDLSIVAANGQHIDVDLDASGEALSATLATADGTRTVAYDTTATVSTVTYYPNTAYEYGIRYDQAGERLGALTVLDAAGQNALFAGAPAQWDFGYTGAAVTHVGFPEHAQGATSSASFSYAAGPSGEGTATVTRSGAVVEGSAQEVLQTYTWNPTGTMKSYCSPRTAAEAPAWWEYEYAPGNEVCLERSPTGATLERVVDSRGNTLHDFDEKGHRNSWLYDEFDQVVRHTDPRGAATYYTYDQSGNLTGEEAILNAEGEKAVRLCSYNASGTVTEERQKLSDTEWAITRYADFAPCGVPQAEHQDAVKLSADSAAVTLTSRKHYDGFGNITSEIDALGATTTSNDYGSLGLYLEASEDASGVASHTRHDLLGNSVETWRSAPGTAIKADWREVSVDALGHNRLETAYLHDGAQTQVQTTVSRQHDGLGRELHVDDTMVAGQPGLSQYDARGNPTKQWSEGLQVHTDLNASRSDYDEYGQLVRTWASGETSPTTYVYDIDGTVLSQTNSDGGRSHYTYDEAGNRLTETDQDGAQTLSEYDIAGRLVSSTSADGITTSYSFDLAGRQMTASGEGNEDPSTTEYNSLGWSMQAVDADGIVTTTTYDAAGRTVSTSVAGKTTTHVYDAAGRTVATIDPDGKRLSYSYDPFGRSSRERHTTEAGLVKDEVTEYDSLGRLSRTVDDRTGLSRTNAYATAPGSGSSVEIRYGSVVTTVAIDAAGEETARTTQIAGLPAISRTVTERDSSRRETAWTVGSVAFGRQMQATDGQLASLSVGASTIFFGYDASGRKASETGELTLAGDMGATYTYTDAGRLASDTASGPASYEFDAAGNLTTETAGATQRRFEYDSGNRLVSMTEGHSTTTFGWDTANGWRTSSRASGETTVTYQYTGTGRLEHYSDPNRGIEAQYSYDAGGQRLTSTVTSGTTVIATRYLYEGLSLLSLGATETGGAIETTYSITYLYDASGSPYAGIYRSGEATPVPFAITTTDRGDVVELSDSNGVAFAAYRYDAWGVHRDSECTTTGTAAVDTGIASRIAKVQALRYAGYCFDEHSQHYYLNARYYDPVTRHFLSKDPASADGEKSAYQYCQGNPVGMFDRSGMWQTMIKFRTGADMWNQFWEVLQVNAGYAVEKLRYFALRGNPGGFVYWLVQMVDSNKPWDFKADIPSTPRRAAKSRMLKVFTWGARRISLDDIGNIHFGYVMAALSVPRWVSVSGATFAGMVNNPTWKQWHHEMRNNYWIKYGWNARMYSYRGASVYRPARGRLPNLYVRGAKYKWSTWW